MLDPTYNDPSDVSRRCGHLLICQVHVTRWSPHTPHFTRSHITQSLTDSFACYNTTLLCVQKTLRDAAMFSVPPPHEAYAACAETRPVARHAHCRMQSITCAPIRLRPQSLSFVTRVTFFHTPNKHAGKTT